jgi:hypothetical protein
MAQGDECSYTREEIDAVLISFEKVFKAVPKSRRVALRGHAHTIRYLLEACYDAASAEADAS